MNPTAQDIPAISLRGHYSGLISRLLAFIIDSVVVSVVLISTAWFIKSTWTMLGLRGFLNALARSSPVLQSILNFLYSPYFVSLVTFLIIISYHVIFWTFAGQTIGKAVMGIKVVSFKGKRMTVARSLLRYFSYFVSALPLGLGYFWILIDDKRMGWHDHLSGTRVIYVWEARPDEVFLTSAIEKIQAPKKAIKAYLDQRKNSV
jgi:uncharacterized RDD family membrane protein YckC